MAFSLWSQFHVCGCECYKLYSGKRCILGEEKRLGGETVWASNIRFGYCAIMTDDVFAQPMTAPPKINIYNEHLHGTVTLLRPVLQREYAESEEKKANCLESQELQRG